MAKCPFIDPLFDIEMDEPCPVCGMLGHINSEDKCVCNRINAGDELHQISGAALQEPSQ
jgi:hypothetical protein